MPAEAGTQAARLRPGQPRVLLLAWPGADWALIQPLLDAGRLPHLAALVQRGAMGKLMAPLPLLAPALAASLATGGWMDAHGISAWVKPGPGGLGVTPMDADDLRLPTMWAQAASAGLRACAVGWPNTHPVRPSGACVVSQAFVEARGTSFEDWPVAAGSVWPPALAEELAELRLHPSEVDAEQVLAFCPQAARIDQETDQRLPQLVASFARAASTHGVGTFLAERGDWDLLAVHFDLIERLSTAFLACSAPQMAQVSATDHQLYGQVVDGAYQFMDLLLGRYLALVDADTHVLLVSAHGFLTGAQRPGPVVPGMTSQAYRSTGVLVAAGPSLAPDSLVFGATVLDIAPTVLQLLGVQAPVQGPGQVLHRLFSHTLPPGRPIDTLAQAPACQPQAAVAADALADWARGRLAELQAWGDLAPLAADPEVAAEHARITQLDHLARAHMAQGQHRQALAVLAELCDLAPGRGPTLLAQAMCHLALDEPAPARVRLETCLRTGQRGALVHTLLGQLAVKEGDAAAARAHLQRAEQAANGGADALALVGQSHLLAQDWPEAERTLRACLARNPEHAAAHHDLGRALASQGLHDQAVPHYRRSIGLLYHRAPVHHALGASLAALGQLPQALQAFAQALEIEPGHAPSQAAAKQVQRAWATQTVQSSPGRQAPTG